MNHAFYLSKMPQELKQRIEAESVYAPWLRRGETLESIWSNPAIMETVYRELSVRERNVLHILVASIGSEPFDWPRLERQTLPVMSGAEAKVGFLLLLKKGLVYMFRKSWGEHVYVLAEDALALWQRLLIPSLPGPLQSLAGESGGMEYHEASGAGLTSLLFQTLVLFEHNEMKLTKSGALHKKQLQKWSELLTLNDERFTGLSLKYAYADIYPFKIAVMLEFLSRLQLIEQREEQFGLRERAVHRWLSITEREQTKQLYRIWQRVAFPGTAWLQHAALLMERQPVDVWFTAEGLVQWLHANKLLPAGLEDPARFQELVEQLKQQWIYPLTAFGWVEQGTAGADGDPALYRWRVHPLEAAATPAESGEEGFYVQPDFEILVPPHVSSLVRWELSAIADQVKADLVSVYKLGKESLQRGLEKGRKLDELLRFLDQHSLYGIPDNVKLTLEQWAKPFGKVQLAEVLLLRCEDAEVAEAVGKLPGSAECLLEPIGDRAWIIREDQLKRLTELLDKAGWMPGKLKLLGDSGPLEGSKPAGSTRAPEDEVHASALDQRLGDYSTSKADSSGDSIPIADKGFLYSKHTFMYFDMEPKIPEVRDLYPDLQGVPQGWMKDYRTYHASTRREMVEKALEWKTALQIRHNGLDQVIAPRKLQETRGSWSMTGLEQSGLQEICLFSEDLQEMKIILPGINDKY